MHVLIIHQYITFLRVRQKLKYTIRQANNAWNQALNTSCWSNTPTCPQLITNKRPQTWNPCPQSNALPHLTNAAHIRHHCPRATNYTPIAKAYATPNSTAAGHALNHNISRSTPPTIKSKPIQFTAMSSPQRTPHQKYQHTNSIEPNLPATYAPSHEIHTSQANEHASNALIPKGPDIWSCHTQIKPIPRRECHEPSTLPYQCSTPAYAGRSKAPHSNYPPELPAVSAEGWEV